MKNAPHADGGLRGGAAALLGYCKENGWAGYDPYDALNSALFCATPFYKSRMCRIALTQALKRLPVNLRPLLGVRREQNPKALALFLSAALKLGKQGVPGQDDNARYMVDRLDALRSPGLPYWCWGYSFPWQGRSMLVPKWAPNLVCTVFVAGALLDAHEETKDPRCLEMALSAARYVLNELYWEGGGEAGFCYPLPTLRSKVHNANFLGAALFCRIYNKTGMDEFLAPAMKAARYSARRQGADGMWAYGESAKQGWADNFHTGYNLCALRDVGRYAGTDEFEENVRLGFKFYVERFFREDGAPRYFHDRTYPVDVHSVAQAIITLTKLRAEAAQSAGLAKSVLGYAMDNMRDPEGYFYYRVHPAFKNRISYMRWSQAWMLLALATLMEAE